MTQFDEVSVPIVDYTGIRTYPWSCRNPTGEMLRVTPEGEIERDGKNITDDDAAVADAMREFVKVAYGVTIRAANRWVSA